MNLTGDYVEIDGRQVPTYNGLRKMGLLIPDPENPDDPEAEIFVAQRNEIIDEDYWITPEQVRMIVWSLQKYSSVTFMQQLREVLVRISEGYEKYLDGKECYEEDTDNIRNFNDSIVKLNTAIDLRLKGDTSANQQLQGVNSFDDCFVGRRADYMDWEPIGKAKRYGLPSTGLYAWIEKAIDMAFKIAEGGCWTWPSEIAEKDIKFPPPPSFKYEPSKDKIRAKTGDAVPVSGVWNPFDYKSGCPSYLIVGKTFPKIDIAIKKTEYLEYVDDYGKHNETNRLFDYEERETQWELLWEDKRYLDGKIPKEEADYLDESCSFPNEPPIAIQN